MTKVKLRLKETTQTLNTLNSLLIESIGKSLEGHEIDMFCEIWENKSKPYQKIADDIGMSRGGAVKAADRMYKTLQLGLKLPPKIKITKGNLRVVVEPIISAYTQKDENNSFEDNNSIVVNTASLSEKIEANNKINRFNREFYLDRPLEEEALNLLSQNGVLLRVIGSEKNGKTLFVKSVLDKVTNCDRLQLPHTIEIDLELSPLRQSNDLERTNDFCKWLCTYVTAKLDLPVQTSMNQYWIEGIGGKAAATDYFDRYLLKTIDRPLILAFDNLKLLLRDFPQAGNNIFSLLRSWYNSRILGEAIPHWKKLSLILVYRPESLPSEDNDVSPIFNLGSGLKLKGFNLREVLELAKKYNVSCKEEDALKIVKLLKEGKPYLVRRFFTELSPLMSQNGNTNLEMLLLKFRDKEPYKSYCT